MQKRRLLLLTFLGCFATILIERGIFFYAREWLAFTDMDNLLLALLWGIAYVIGARFSHPFCERLGERRVILGLIGGQITVFSAMVIVADAPLLVALTGLVGLQCGMTWPIAESYVMSGLTPNQSGRAVGRFNLSLVGPHPLGASGRRSPDRPIPGGYFYFGRFFVGLLYGHCTDASGATYASAGCSSRTAPRGDRGCGLAVCWLRPDGRCCPATP